MRGRGQARAPFSAASACDERADRVLHVARAHERLADEDPSTPTALQLVELVAAVDARLGDDRLARRDLGQQLVRAVEVDRKSVRSRLLMPMIVGVDRLQRALQLALVVHLHEHVEVERLASPYRSVSSSTDSAATMSSSASAPAAAVSYTW